MTFTATIICHVSIFILVFFEINLQIIQMGNQNEFL